MADTNLFPDEAGFTPRPAWRVIEAARRQCLTGELTLPTNPSTKIYLRDGAIYFAERSSDGGLPIRLMMEGVINREQMKRGTVIVNGVEHVGRMFDNDPTIDRASVELCAELFTDDVMIEIANEQVSSYELVLYRRHPSGIDRWYPQGVPVFARSADSSAVGPVTTHESIEEAPAKSSVKVKAKTEARPEPKQEPKPEAKAEPKPALKNKLNAPPITQAVPIVAPATPPPTTSVPVTPSPTTSIPVTPPVTATLSSVPMPAPTAQVPVTAAASSTELDASAIADEVTEAIRRALAGMNPGL